MFTGPKLVRNAAMTALSGSGLFLLLSGSSAFAQKVAAGAFHSVFLKPDGTMWASGFNSDGQLGDGSLVDRRIPLQVASGVNAVAAGWAHTLFVKADGALWAMGDNASGQLGDGSLTDRRTPVQVASGVSSVSAGGLHSLFVKTDGTLWAMGNNEEGQLGDGTLTSRRIPVQVASRVRAASAGAAHSLFVKTDGTLWAMGDNELAQLGDGTLSDRLSPVQVASGVSAVSAGLGHSLFVKTDGTLWAMGLNGNGQLGDGSQTARLSPVQVASGVSAVSAGGGHSLFVKTDGTLWAMGFNLFGQLGDVSLTDRSTPVQVASGVNAVSGGGRHSLFLRTTGAFLGMGGNAIGQLGDGTTIDRSSPAQIFSAPATVAGNPTSVLSNLSVRTSLAVGQTLIVGAVLNGSKTILTRAVGPTLSAFGLQGMDDPRLEIYSSGSSPIATNDNWSSALAPVFNSVGAFAFSAGSKDAAINQSLGGSFTVQAKGAGAGAILVELYDVTRGASPRLVNISVRNRVGTGSDVLIAGFAISGTSAKNLVIRAVGPGLAQFGLSGTLTDPRLQVYEGNNVIATNDNWEAPLALTFSSVGAFGLPAGSRDAALAASLRPGIYTVMVSGADSGTGEALVEVYELP